MPSIFSRLTYHQKLFKKPSLTLEQKSVLGNTICQSYLSQTEIKKALHYMVSKEPEGEFKVLSYPKKFVPEIDRLISEYYKNVPREVVKRKRIPTKPTLEKSVKPTNISNGNT